MAYDWNALEKVKKGTGIMHKADSKEYMHEYYIKVLKPKRKKIAEMESE